MSLVLYALGAALICWGGYMLAAGDSFAALDIAASLAGWGVFAIGLGVVASAIGRLTRAVEASARQRGAIQPPVAPPAWLPSAKPQPLRADRRASPDGPAPSAPFVPSNGAAPALDPNRRDDAKGRPERDVGYVPPAPPRAPLAERPKIPPMIAAEQLRAPKPAPRAEVEPPAPAVKDDETESDDWLSKRERRRRRREAAEAAEAPPRAARSVSSSVEPAGDAQIFSGPNDERLGADRPPPASAPIDGSRPSAPMRQPVEDEDAIPSALDPESEPAAKGVAATGADRGDPHVPDWLARARARREARAELAAPAAAVGALAAHDVAHDVVHDAPQETAEAATPAEPADEPEPHSQVSETDELAADEPEAVKLAAPDTPESIEEPEPEAVEIETSEDIVEIEEPTFAAPAPETRKSKAEEPELNEPEAQETEASEVLEPEPADPVVAAQDPEPGTAVQEPEAELSAPADQPDPAASEPWVDDVAAQETADVEEEAEAQAVSEEPGERTLSETEEPKLVREGEHRGVTYRFFDDGSVEAISPHGARRFATVEDLRATVIAARGADYVEPEPEYEPEPEPQPEPAPQRVEEDPLEAALSELESGEEPHRAGSRKR